MTSACVFERMHCFSKKIACYLIRNCSPTENEFKNLTINRSYFFFTILNAVTSLFLNTHIDSINAIYHLMPLCHHAEVSHPRLQLRNL